jgi:indolepyruvate ferredoxin oxidoreductase alpha subunit
MKQLMTGNEAVARGAYEAGLVFASAYPGTPSTEILETLGTVYRDSLYSEWAPNEKVALEAALGASIAGVRAMACMKHVGLNVAADPLFTVAYTGVTGGLVVVSADDPGMHSSQNEQDNRNYASAARVMMLEPSDSQEAKDMTKLAFELSERFDTPVLLRMTTRVCHSKGMVELGERVEKEPIEYRKNIAKYVSTPANAKVSRKNLPDRLAREEAYANDCAVNTIEPAADAKNGKGRIGVACSGVSYEYAKEVFGEKASYLKLGLTYPFPVALAKKFAETVETVYVVEEVDPYIENNLKVNGIACVGKDVVPAFDELNPDILRTVFHPILPDVVEDVPETLRSDLQAVVRPPAMCAGCPHRGFYYALSKKKGIMVTGDIGCYTLGAAPPLSAIDTTICMGASVSSGHGASVAFKRTGRDTKVVSCIGDSTFFHSGVTSLMDAIYNKGTNVTVILDNRITGMTGHQENPGTGYTLMGEETTEVDIPALCVALGMKPENIRTVNPLNLKECDEALDEALARDEASVIITKWPCALKKFSREDRETFDLSPKVAEVDQDRCRRCGLCSKTGCPAIYKSLKVTINKESCTGCGVCAQVCPFGAIKVSKR